MEFMRERMVAEGTMHSSRSWITIEEGHKEKVNMTAEDKRWRRYIGDTRGYISVW